MQKDLCTSQRCRRKNYRFCTCKKTKYPRTSAVQWQHMSIVYSATDGSDVMVHSIGHPDLQTSPRYLLFVGYSKRFYVIAKF